MGIGDMELIIKFAGPIGIILFITFMAYKEWVHRKDGDTVASVRELRDDFIKLSDQGFSKLNSITKDVREGTQLDTKVLQITEQLADVQATQTEILHKMHLDTTKILERLPSS